MQACAQRSKQTCSVPSYASLVTFDMHCKSYYVMSKCVARLLAHLLHGLLAVCHQLHIFIFA